jgi:sugar phosphate isomerase/epimerase
MELRKLGDRHVMEHLLDNMPELKAQFHIGQFLPERGIALPDWIAKYAGRICSLHLNDAGAEGPARLGDGDCGAEESIKAALDAGIDTYILETRLTKGTVEGVRRDVEFARRLIG